MLQSNAVFYDDEQILIVSGPSSLLLSSFLVTEAILILRPIDELQESKFRVVKSFELNTKNCSRASARNLNLFHEKLQQQLTV